MDLTLLRTLNSLTGHGWDWLFVFCAAYLQYILGAAVVLYSFVPRRRIRLLEAAFGSAIVARVMVAPLIQLSIHRARPFVVLHDLFPLIQLRVWEFYRAMPSGHALFFFALASASYHYDRRLGGVLFVGAVIISISRIIVGVHWPSDVLVGALIGTGVGWAVVYSVPSLRTATRRV